MQEYRYLIVGGGMTGHAAAAAIREMDPHAGLGMIGEEPVPPYARPALIRGFLHEGDRTEAFLPRLQGLVHHAGRRAVALDPQRREVVDDRGEGYRYERLLLATGATSRRLALAGDRVIHLRSFEDYRRLRAGEGEGAVVVVGGGYVGTEVAAALAEAGRDVTLIFPESGLGARLWPAELSGHVTRAFEARGVRLLRGHAVARAEPFGDRVLLRTTGGAEVLAGLVVAGLGVQPCTALAEAAGLAVSDGIEVDEGLRTSAPGIWAAGDVARAPCPVLGERVRVEHAENALSMGREAGRAMAGATVRWSHLPTWSATFFDDTYEAVGKLDARMQTVAAWRRPFREGAVYYLEHGRVKGVLLWGLPGHLEAARELIRRQRVVAADELRFVLGR